MKRNYKVSDEPVGRGYQVFKEYPVKTKREKVKIELQYVVPWELTANEFKKSTR